MSEASQAAGQAGEPHVLTANGKSYPVSMIDQIVKDAFAKRMFKKAREAEKMCRDDYVVIREENGKTVEDTSEYDRRLDHVNQRFINGEFDFLTWMSEAQKEKDKKKLQPTMMMLIELLLNVDQKELLELMVDNEREISSLVQLIIKESLPQPKKKKEGADPNLPRVADAAQT